MKLLLTRLSHYKCELTRHKSHLLSFVTQLLKPFWRVSSFFTLLNTFGYAAKDKATSIAMMAMAHKSSIKVNALRLV
jgi:hypothetical protein